MRALLFALLLIPSLALAQNPNTLPASQGVATWIWDGVKWVPNTGSGTTGGLAGITITNKSGTIAAGGATNQIAIAANTARVTCHVQPQTTDIFIAPATTAPLSASSEYATVLTEYTCPAGYKGAVAVSGLTTGASYYADEGTVP